MRAERRAKGDLLPKIVSRAPFDVRGLFRATTYYHCFVLLYTDKTPDTHLVTVL